MIPGSIQVQSVGPLSGTVSAAGAKNAVLVQLAATVLVDGESVISNVPACADVFYMLKLLQQLGALVQFDQEHRTVRIDARALTGYTLDAEIMRKMRASILLMGALLARVGKACMSVPGGCPIGARPVDFHLRAFAQMGAQVTQVGDLLTVTARQLKPVHLVLEYPSVGATENVILASVCTQGVTKITNAAIEPEVLDFIDMLNKAGAKITVSAPASILIEGVSSLRCVNHSVMPDRLEAGCILLAGVITGGTVIVDNARASDMDVFLSKLTQMGHQVTVGHNGIGLTIVATKLPEAVSFKTGPFPGFPTDLQAPMTAALCLAAGSSVIHETVYENRLLQAPELQKMGAVITLSGCDRMTIKGVSHLTGTQVQATDIRASCALVLAGLAARGTTTIFGLNHWRRGYDGLEHKLIKLGANITIHEQMGAEASISAGAAKVS